MARKSPLRLPEDNSAPLPDPYSAEEFTQSPIEDRSALRRGLYAGVQRVNAGALARQATVAESRGDTDRASALRDQSRRLARAGAYATQDDPQRLSEVDSIGDFSKFVFGQIGQQAPIMAAPLTTGAAGAAAGGLKGGVPGAVAGGLIGAFGPSYTLSRNEMAQSIMADPKAMEQPVEIRKRAEERYGLGAGALESTVGALPVVGNVAGRAATRAVLSSKGLARQQLKNITREARFAARGPLARASIGAAGAAAVEAPIEGLTEYLQTGLQQRMLTELNPERDTSQDRAERREAATIGALLGGIMGLPFGGVSGLRTRSAGARPSDTALERLSALALESDDSLQAVLEADIPTKRIALAEMKLSTAAEMPDAEVDSVFNSFINNLSSNVELHTQLNAIFETLQEDGVEYTLEDDPRIVGIYNILKDNLEDEALQQLNSALPDNLREAGENTASYLAAALVMSRDLADSTNPDINSARTAINQTVQRLSQRLPEPVYERIVKYLAGDESSLYADAEVEERYEALTQRFVNFAEQDSDFYQRFQEADAPTRRSLLIESDVMDEAEASQFMNWVESGGLVGQTEDGQALLMPIAMEMAIQDRVSRDPEGAIEDEVIEAETFAPGLTRTAGPAQGLSLYDSLLLPGVRTSADTGKTARIRVEKMIEEGELPPISDEALDLLEENWTDYEKEDFRNLPEELRNIAVVPVSEVRTQEEVQQELSAYYQNNIAGLKQRRSSLIQEIKKKRENYNRDEMQALIDQNLPRRDAIQELEGIRLIKEAEVNPDQMEQLEARENLLDAYLTVNAAQTLNEEIKTLERVASQETSPEQQRAEIARLREDIAAGEAAQSLDNQTVYYKRLYRARKDADLAELQTELENTSDRANVKRAVLQQLIDAKQLEDKKQRLEELESQSLTRIVNEARVILPQVDPRDAGANRQYLNVAQTTLRRIKRFKRRDDRVKQALGQIAFRTTDGKTFVTNASDLAYAERAVYGNYGEEGGATNAVKMAVSRMLAREDIEGVDWERTNPVVLYEKSNGTQVLVRLNEAEGRTPDALKLVFYKNKTPVIVPLSKLNPEALVLRYPPGKVVISNYDQVNADLSIDAPMPFTLNGIPFNSIRHAINTFRMGDFDQKAYDTEKPSTITPVLPEALLENYRRALILGAVQAAFTDSRNKQNAQRLVNTGELELVIGSERKPDEAVPYVDQAMYAVRDQLAETMMPTTDANLQPEDRIYAPYQLIEFIKEYMQDNKLTGIDPRSLQATGMFYNRVQFTLPGERRKTAGLDAKELDKMKARPVSRIKARDSEYIVSSSLKVERDLKELTRIVEEVTGEELESDVILDVLWNIKNYRTYEPDPELQKKLQGDYRIEQISNEEIEDLIERSTRFEDAITVTDRYYGSLDSSDVEEMFNVGEVERWIASAVEEPDTQVYSTAPPKGQTLQQNREAQERERQHKTALRAIGILTDRALTPSERRYLNEGPEERSAPEGSSILTREDLFRDSNVGVEELAKVLQAGFASPIEAVPDPDNPILWTLGATEEQQQALWVQMMKSFRERMAEDYPIEKTSLDYFIQQLLVLPKGQIPKVQLMMRRTARAAGWDFDSKTNTLTISTEALGFKNRFTRGLMDENQFDGNMTRARETKLYMFAELLARKKLDDPKYVGWRKKLAYVRSVVYGHNRFNKPKAVDLRLIRRGLKYTYKGKERTLEKLPRNREERKRIYAAILRSNEDLKKRLEDSGNDILTGLDADIWMELRGTDTPTVMQNPGTEAQFIAQMVGDPGFQHAMAAIPDMHHNRSIWDTAARTVFNIEGLPFITHPRQPFVPVKERLGVIRHPKGWLMLDFVENIQNQYGMESTDSARIRLSAAGEKVKKEIQENLATVFPELNIIYRQFVGGTARGETKGLTSTIRLALNNEYDNTSVAWHEAFHQWINQLLKGNKSERRLAQSLLNAADTDQVLEVLEQKVAEVVDESSRAAVLAQIRSNPSERLAYAFQFFQNEGIDVRFTPETETLFERVMRWFRELLGPMPDTTIDLVFEALKEGKLTNRAAYHSFVYNNRLQTVKDQLRNKFPLFIQALDTLFATPVQRMLDIGIPEIDNIALQYYQPPGMTQEGENLPFFQARMQQLVVWRDRVEALLQQYYPSGELPADVLLAIQTGADSDNEFIVQLRELLDDLFDYMKDAGVKRLDANGEFQELRRVKNYFVRSWRRDLSLDEQNSLVQLMVEQSNGELNPEEAREIVENFAISSDNDIKDSTNALGMSLQERKLTFIKPDNAELFMPFFEQNLISSLDRYLYQAVTRAEATKRFGNLGVKRDETLDRLVDENRISRAQRLFVQKRIAELEGTANPDFPRWGHVLNEWLLTFANLRVLELAAFTMLIDPIGIGVRTGSVKESFKQLGLTLAPWVKSKPTRLEQERMAEIIGVVERDAHIFAAAAYHSNVITTQMSRNINRTFFKVTGVEWLNKQARTNAMSVAQIFIRSLPDDSRNGQRYLKELGLDAELVRAANEHFDDGLKMYRMDYETGIFEGLTKEQSDTLKRAIYRFVDESILRPNPGVRAGWMSDPAFAVIAHLKSFTFAFHEILIRRALSEARHNNYQSLYALGSVAPVMIVSDVLKRALFAVMDDEEEFEYDLGDAVHSALIRANPLGKGTFALESYINYSNGYNPVTDLMGPTVDWSWDMLKWLSGNPRQTTKRTMISSIPFASTAEQLDLLPDAESASD